MNIEKIKAVNPGNYAMKAEEVGILLEEAHENAFRALILAFNYGFMRGQNAEKNRAKKKAVKK